MKTGKIKWSKLFEIFLILFVPVLIALVSIRVWKVDFSVPLGLGGGDGGLISTLLKSIEENGWKGAFFNERLGAPGRAELIDVPFLDVLFILLAWIINIITGNFAVTYYIIYIVMFPLCALSMYFLLTKFEIPYVIKFVFSVLFATAPGHFYREFSHITITAYFTIPLGIYLAFIILQEDCNIKKKVKKQKWLNAALAVMIGFGQMYYAFFSLIIMCMAVLWKMIKNKSLKPLLKEAKLIYLIMLCVITSLLPKLIYGIIAGKNLLAGIRNPIESELYGMKLVQLLLPVTYSRIPVFRKVIDYYVTKFPNLTENTLSSLGTIAAVGFLGICVWFIYSFISKDRREEKFDFIALSTLVLVLFCTIGGFGTLFSIFITPQIRTLNRASILIMCFCLLFLALLFQKYEILCKKKYKVKIFLFLLLLFGLYDQVPIKNADWHTGRQVAFADYQRFFEEIEKNLEENAMVYQLPWMDFPEVPMIYNMMDYAHFSGYLLTDKVRWSYGGIKGRPNEAEELLCDDGKSMKFIENIMNAGFQGVYIDTYGFEDGGTAINEFYQKELGLTPLVTDDGRLYFYLLRPE